jgi:hypothetical protein
MEAILRQIEESTQYNGMAQVSGRARDYLGRLVSHDSRDSTFVVGDRIILGLTCDCRYSSNEAA